MLSLILAGLVMIVAGSLITRMKFDRKLEIMLKGVPIAERVAGRTGLILFIIGLLCVIAGVADLYYI
jgi:hypothetical protein